MKFAHPLGTAKLSFPGPSGGYTLARFGLQSVTDAGDTVVNDRWMLIDLGVSNDGTYVPKEDKRFTAQQDNFTFVLSKERQLHVILVPTESHREFQVQDSTFFGTLGIGFFKHHTSVFDFKTNTLTLYPLFANIDVSPKDTNALQLQYLDDAVLTYCHCPFPTMWFDVEAAPLKSGHVQLAFNEPQSKVFMPALDDASRKRWDSAPKDTVTGKKQVLGFALGQFKLGGENIAWRNPRRVVDELPPLFRDLSVPILGTMGTDVLRTFSSIIIDPARSRIILVK